MITTVQGQQVTVTINAQGVFINNAQVTVADVLAQNGVVHVINAVLVPILSNVQEQSAAQYTIYPNPANDVLNVRVQNGHSTKYQIMDASGRLVAKGNLNGQLSISIDQLESGMYTIAMEQNGAVTTSKFVKQ
jgi:hypothetical protein